MKTCYRDLLYALITSSIIGFMFFIYEPIVMYANNIDDFWFDFQTLIGPTLLFCLFTTLISFVFFFVIYIFAKKIKHINIYYIVLLMTILCFICAYIHSNFLANFLPPLDGTPLDWGNLSANISSIAVCLILIIALVVSIIKIGIAKTLKYSIFINIAIFIMLSTSLFSTFITTPIFKAKEILTTSTVKNLNLVSTNRNYMIFLVDAVDSTHFNKIVKENEEYQKALKDFSYFPDTLSGYAFTRDSIPFIFSGVWNENTEPFPEYSAKALDSSPFFAELSNQNYNKNLYDYDLIWNSRKAIEFDNINSIEKNVNKTAFFKQEVKYILFKILPFPLKSLSRIDNIDFSLAQHEQEDDTFRWDNIDFYQNLQQPISKTDQKYFQYIHIEGAHTPFNLSRNLTIIPEENSSYEEKLEATMVIILAYLDRLKENNAYDNATIIILADHGFWYQGTTRANPILYIKGENEKHDKTIISAKQVSHIDLVDAFTELLKGKHSTEIFSNLPENGRTRRFLYNGFNEEEHLYEYETNSKAWDADALKTTGKVFDL